MTHHAQDHEGHGGRTPGRVQVAVHNGLCQHYGICQQEAPEVFTLRGATYLAYDTTPSAQDTAAVQQAARLCPAQAITVDPA